ncbi:hypothetical protein H7J07_06760 [Mycobacterium koreense]|uniref:Uncharacterized protein n=1 Tax=Mycolicibacillus koreensis TaxID=1069220 RepID=A0A7I7SHD7_9MYCO|nr:hypothetical protein [Mycolicibacillus koreensis]MCV7247920.1 hypothetical protein [Mycolicibacillus koreensis]OSC23709.1 hypothetical protein B8W67_19780 [Mycolicibacillus koreensis]BBY56163.1 hypothetical protein MKOR_34140 [Mycolicibacillus koreensis]
MGKFVFAAALILVGILLATHELVGPGLLLLAAGGLVLFLSARTASQPTAPPLPSAHASARSEARQIERAARADASKLVRNAEAAARKRGREAIAAAQARLDAERVERWLA